MEDRTSIFDMKDLNRSRASDVGNFPEAYDVTAPPVGTDMAGHDTFLLGPKVVVLDSFIVDLLNVDTSAQTFKLKLILNLGRFRDFSCGIFSLREASTHPFWLIQLSNLSSQIG